MRPSPFLPLTQRQLQLLIKPNAVAQLARIHTSGGVVEWLMAPVLKTGRAQALVGSNPTPSAISLVIYSKFSPVRGSNL